MKVTASTPATILAAIVLALAIPLGVAALLAWAVALTAMLCVLQFGRLLRLTSRTTSNRTVHGSVIEGEFRVVDQTRGQGG